MRSTVHWSVKIVLASISTGVRRGAIRPIGSIRTVPICMLNGFTQMTVAAGFRVTSSFGLYRYTFDQLGRYLTLNRTVFNINFAGQPLFRQSDQSAIGSNTQIRKLGWNGPQSNEPFTLPAESPQRMERLCLRAVAEGAISEPKAAQLLNISVRALDRRLMAQMA